MGLMPGHLAGMNEAPMLQASYIEATLRWKFNYRIIFNQFLSYFFRRNRLLIMLNPQVMNRMFCLLLFAACSAQGQHNEFAVYSNGLIYDSTTMGRLCVIVDSLNIKFRTCDLSRPYYSNYQGTVNVVEVPNKKIRALIQKGISFETFAGKFPNKIVKRNVWMERDVYAYDHKRYISFSGVDQLDYSFDMEDHGQITKVTGWIFNEDSTAAIYLNKFSSFEIPHEYGRLVQYVDCMVDTTAKIYLEELSDENDDPFEGENENTNANAYLTIAADFPGEPVHPEWDREKEKESDSLLNIYYRQYNIWDSLRLLALDEKMKTPSIRNMLIAAKDEALKTHKGSASIDFYVTKYLTKEDALAIKRNYKVMGVCSMDTRPREHVRDICKLAAETASWEIFLRSHLDIMNDRFERATDGSYAWAGRKTYLKELEELGIPATDLLLGTCFQVENVSANHYGGSVRRVGRALADAEDKNALEEKFIRIIRDEKLDLNNRIAFFYVFDSYTFHLDDGDRKKNDQKMLETLVDTLPAFVKMRWRQ
jgi:hypothetical protein